MRPRNVVEVQQIMKRPVQTIDCTDTVEKAAEEMAIHRVGALAVQTRDHVAGIITDRDIVVRCLASGLRPAQTVVGGIMSTSPVTVSPDNSIDRAVQLMSIHHVHRLPVLEDGHLVGIISASDIARYCRDEDTITELAHALAEPAGPIARA
jgi:CBS domain-containing protein